MLRTPRSGKTWKLLGQLRNALNREYLRKDVANNTVETDGYTSLLLISYDTGAIFPLVVLRKSDSDTVGTLAETDDNDVMGRVAFQGVNSSSEAATGAAIAGEQNGAAGATYVPMDLAFYTGTDAAAPVERMRIASDGKISFETGIVLDVLSANVSDPPSDAEIDSATGTTPAAVGSGYCVLLKDTDSNGFWFITSDGSNWFYNKSALAT